MKIIREYEMEKAYYAQVERDDGERIELKIRKDAAKSKPSANDWKDLEKSMPFEINNSAEAVQSEVVQVEIFLDGERIG